MPIRWSKAKQSNSGGSGGNYPSVCVIDGTLSKREGLCVCVCVCGCVHVCMFTEEVSVSTCVEVNTHGEQGSGDGHEGLRAVGRVKGDATHTLVNRVHQK